MSRVEFGTPLTIDSESLSATTCVKCCGKTEEGGVTGTPVGGALNGHSHKSRHLGKDSVWVGPICPLWAVRTRSSDHPHLNLAVLGVTLEPCQTSTLLYTGRHCSHLA